MKYKIKNWEKYQHYKDRNPPWIKLHFEILSSEDWVMLADASRVLAIALMLVASRNDGVIDGSIKGLAYIKRVAYLNNKPDLKPLLDSGFIVSLADASTCKQMLADACSETETETETEESRARAREARPGRIITNPATASDLSWIAPTEKQLVMLTDKANQAGTTVEEAAAYLGIPVAGVNVGRIKDHLEQQIAQAAQARASPKTFAQLKRERTREAAAAELRRIACSEES